jgi:hypothetical protein
MPTYKVERPGQKPRVVDAPNPAAARNHVANDEITVSKITASVAFKLASDGAKLETAGEEPPKPQPPRESFDSGEEELERN